MSESSYFTNFDPSFLIEYDAMCRSHILNVLQHESFVTQPKSVELRQDMLEATFGTLDRDHAFNTFCPEWGIKLLERQATGGLAYLLGRGTGEVRGERIRAFLQALKVPDLPGIDVLGRASVEVEKKRIDLLVQFSAASASGVRVVIIEVKFDNVLRRGQLKRYYNHYKGYEPCCRIIALNPNIASGLWGKQHRIWRICLWRDVWLRFERARPVETDSQLSVFQAWIWERIGGLRPGRV